MFARDIAQLPRGTHACLVYRNAREQFDAALPFIHAGVERGDRCIYICDDRSIDEIGAGFDAVGIRRDAVALITKRDAYLRSGAFDPRLMIEFLRDTASAALRDGFSGLCVTGEMTWALGPEIGNDRLIEYEALLNDVIPGSRIVALCQYNRERMPAGIIRDVLRTHPTVLAGGRLFDRNPYFEPGSSVLGAVSEDDRVTWMLAQLERFSAGELARSEVERLQREYARIVECSNDAIYARALDGTVTSWNPAAESLYGHPAAEVIGRIDTIVPPERAGELTSLLDRVGRDESIERIDTERVKKDGTRVEVSLTVSPIRDDTGRVVGASIIGRDITEQRRAERVTREAALYTRSLIEASLDPLVTISPDGKITDVNKATEEATGIARAALIGTDFADYFTDPEQARRGFREVLERGSVRNYPLTIRDQAGQTIDVMYHATVYRNERGEPQGVFAAARDVTDQKRAHEALRRSERSLREAEQIAHVGSWTYDIATGELVWSDEIYRIFEVDPDAFAASYEAFLNAIHPDDREAVNAAYTASLRDRTPYDTVHRVLMKDGRVKYVHERARTSYRPDGTPLRSIGTVQDVTDIKQAEQALRSASLYARSLIEASLDPLVTISPDGKITDVNSATIDATGVSRIALIGTDFADYFTDPDRAREGYQKVLADGFVRDYPLTIRHVSDSTLDVLYNAAVYRNEAGGLEGVFAAARDVTDLLRAERALQTLNRELEARVAARTAELQASNRELEAFSYSVSHDLRAPLRALQGFARILLEEDIEQLSEQARHYLDLIGQNAAQMDKLIDDLLAFSRLGRQAMQLRSVDVADIVRQALSVLAPEHEGRRVDVHIDAVPACHGDPALLRQVFVNLLSNALKFTRHRDPAWIDVASAPALARAGEVVYVVADNGVGFDMAYADKLFGMFQRLHGATEYEGTGVGLAIVQRVVSRHGGRVWADAAVDRGAKFYVALPAAQP